MCAKEEIQLTIGQHWGLFSITTSHEFRVDIFIRIVYSRVDCNLPFRHFIGYSGIKRQQKWKEKNPLT